MSKVSLNAAAKLAGVSKSTISKAIKSGLISYSERNTAGYQIDIAELARVYPAVLTNMSEPVAIQSPEPIADTSGLAHANHLLKQKLEAAEEQQRRTDAVLEDVREDRDRWRQQAAALLSDQRSRPTSQAGGYEGETSLPAPPAPGFWSRLLGRS